jgi:S-(hydroxymethyl)glutathione dehydrogenase/alcohol dehydrogenase
MNTEAAILVELNKDLELWNLELPELKPGQVLIKIAYSGVCHTQLSEARGKRGDDPYVPHCLGHEGSGVVEKIGDGVTKVKPGDEVILSWMKGSGLNVPGTVYPSEKGNVNAGGITTFSKFSVISENRLTKLPENLSLKDAALIGCAIPTGFGSVINTAKANVGESVIVYGSGGIGLSAIAGAKVSGCYPIIAIDILSSKLEIAKELGADYTIDASKVDVTEELKKIIPGGADLLFEATGNSNVMSSALSLVRSQGGKVVVIGNAAFGNLISFNPQELNQGKQLLGTWGGDNNPDVHFPRYASLITAGKIKLNLIADKTYGLNDINKALNDLESGEVTRPIIDMSI